jgi:hypothetical protein
MDETPKATSARYRTTSTVDLSGEGIGRFPSKDTCITTMLSQERK